MRKAIYTLLCLSLVAALVSCKKEPAKPKIFAVTVQLTYPADSGFSAIAGIEVTAKNTINASSFTSQTDAGGRAVFSLPAGIYEISATDYRSVSGSAIILSGSNPTVKVTAPWDSASVVNLELVASKSSQVIIKELYSGGCPKDDGTGSWQRDQYVILYNNSANVADLSGVCMTYSVTINSNVTNYNYGADGKLWYEAENLNLSLWCIAEFPAGASVAPFSQVVVALYDAVDHTTTYSQSVNLSKPEYYAVYNPELFTMIATPATTIPTSHYMTTLKYEGVKTQAWSLSVGSPAFFIFAPTDGHNATSITADANMNYLYNSQALMICKKIPNSWILDGVEVFKKDATNNKKRLTATIDTGSVDFTNALGYTIYRNVDAAATKAIEGNEAKLVYNYKGGALDTTDPSGIDAEASIAAGAKIVYKDTNNSTNDFHVRATASLR